MDIRAFIFSLFRMQTLGITVYEFFRFSPGQCGSTAASRIRACCLWYFSQKYLGIPYASIMSKKLLSGNWNHSGKHSWIKSTYSHTHTLLRDESACLNLCQLPKWTAFPKTQQGEITTIAKKLLTQLLQTSQSSPQCSLGLSLPGGLLNITPGQQQQSDIYSQKLLLLAFFNSVTWKGR